jgi:hypothetical protein
MGFFGHSDQTIFLKKYWSESMSISTPGKNTHPHNTLITFFITFPPFTFIAGFIINKENHMPEKPGWICRINYASAAGRV